MTWGADSSGTRHGERRLEGQVRVRPCHAWKDRVGILGFILREVWRAAGNFKQESDGIRFGFGNISQATVMDINCAVRERQVSAGRSSRLGSQTLSHQAVFQLTQAAQHRTAGSQDTHKDLGVPT